MNDISTQFMTLFRGRGDAYGSWRGGSIREPLTPDHFHRHLNSSHEEDWIGVYPFTPHGVTWGCIDIDGKDFGHETPVMLDLAHTLRTVLAVKNVNAHIERTTHGYHLWVFPAGGLAPAATMRRALMAACKAVDYDPKEVNPKQETLTPGKLGNYVRLPYPGYYGTNPPDERYFLDETGERLTLERFLATMNFTLLENLEEIAALWTPPATQRVTGPPPQHLAAVIQNLDGLSYTIWRDGPLEGRDRSNTLMKLAYHLRDEHVPSRYAFDIVKDADARWGKFADRSDCDEQIQKIVEKAYA